MTEIKVFDAFSGIGGFRKGLEKSSIPDKKFKFVASSDNDLLCKNVYTKLYKTEQEIFFDDIKLVHTSKNKTGHYAPDFDLFLAGFPCQPFSIAGDKKGFDDERSNVFWKIIEILNKHKPEIILLENVKNLKSHDKGKTYAIIEENLKKCGYHIGK